MKTIRGGSRILKKGGLRLKKNTNLEYYPTSPSSGLAIEDEKIS